ncbi:MarR family winged helix-turn-helix transcriptional regulator [Aliihoeflea sp. 40Bstr573]|uniref:MarR family winged helix-turn-helix transcriptional regulator n=1 Tax=Aliihoeflea sp. 40Bstr573 TaxID=2696467 RepID=UPI0020957272|nr:MarR family transcriptional regulator [Aliihoeflea sp. 40Bstr573]MCO6389412.1 MarR family transcriptional regulator [Aliihoeflea sp. 40Bstr573]
MSIGNGFAMELGRVSRRWRTRLDERLRNTGLNQARWTVLLQLSNFGPASQRELAERVGVEGPTLARVLDRLADQGPRRAPFH